MCCFYKQNILYIKSKKLCFCFGYRFEKMFLLWLVLKDLPTYLRCYGTSLKKVV